MKAVVSLNSGSSSIKFSLFAVDGPGPPRLSAGGKIEKIGGDKVKQVIKVRNGIETEDAKKITKLIKESKMKVQASIQGKSMRVTGAKRDDLQAAMALLRKDVQELPLAFNNFRD